MNKSIQSLNREKEKTELLLSNLEKLKVAGSIDKLQYENLKAEYSSKLDYILQKLKTEEEEIKKYPSATPSGQKGMRRRHLSRSHRRHIARIYRISEENVQGVAEILSLLARHKPAERNRRIKALITLLKQPQRNEKRKTP